MKLAFKTHRVTTLALMQSVLAVIGSTHGSVLLILPGFGGYAPLSLLIALLGTLLIAPSLVQAWPLSRTNPSRSAGSVAVVAVCLQLFPAAVIIGVSTAIGELDGLIYFGVLLWLLALQLATAALISATYQGMAPALYVLLCALLGRIESIVQPWAWPLAPVEPVTSAVVGGLTFASALGLLRFLGLMRYSKGR